MSNALKVATYRFELVTFVFLWANTISLSIRRPSTIAMLDNDGLSDRQQ